MNTLESKIKFSQSSSQKIIKLISEIDMFKGKWSVLENMSITFLNELRNIATIQSIGSSTRIEGANLSDQDIKELIAELDINKLDTRDEQEVVGYYETLELIGINFVLNSSFAACKDIAKLICKSSLANFLICSTSPAVEIDILLAPILNPSLLFAQ